MKYIDLETWKRKDHFRFFYQMDYPQYNICLNIDITHFLEFVKVQNLPFYYAMTHAVMKIVNTMDEFKYRIREGKVVLHDRVDPSFTDMDKDDDLFKIVTVSFKDNLREFVEYAQKISSGQKEYFGDGKLKKRDDLIYITCIPWISFTHVSHTINLNNNDSVPRISWGRYYKEGEKVLLPFSVQVSHALADGYHVGMYVGKLQDYLDTIK